jgi:hypothetical protein
MHYVGLDIHTTPISICAPDEAGQLAGLLPDHRQVARQAQGTTPAAPATETEGCQGRS